MRRSNRMKRILHEQWRYFCRLRWHVDDSGSARSAAAYQDVDVFEEHRAPVNSAAQMSTLCRRSSSRSPSGCRSARCETSEIWEYRARCRASPRTRARTHRIKALGESWEDDRSTKSCLADQVSR